MFLKIQFSYTSLYPQRREQRIMNNNTSPAVNISSDAVLPTEHGNFRMRVFVDKDGAEHSILSVGLDDSSKSPLVRIHSECLTGDAFGSLKCDCGPQLQAAMTKIQEEGCGAVVYLRQEGRGIGLHSKIQAYALQDIGYDTLDANLALGLPADAREYGIAARMLKEAGVKRVRLMTNNPLKIQGLRNNGIHVEKRIEHISGVSLENIQYLSTKGKRMGHILDI